MEPRFEKILDQQQGPWNKFSTGRKKWDDFNMDFLHPIGVAGSFPEKAILNYSATIIYGEK